MVKLKVAQMTAQTQNPCFMYNMCPNSKSFVTKKFSLSSHTVKSYCEVAKLQPNDSCTSAASLQCFSFHGSSLPL